MAKELLTTPTISKTQVTLSNISVATGLLYVALLLLLHVLEPEYDPTWQFISEYALGKFGFLMNLVFVSLVVSILTCGLSILRQVKTWPGYIGLGIFAISALGLLVAAIFNTDPSTTDPAQATFSGTMHYTGASFDFTPLAMLLLTFSLGRTQAWRPVRTKLFFASGISIVLTILFMASMPADYKFGPGTYTGLIGRFLFVSYLVFFWIIGARVRERFKQNQI